MTCGRLLVGELIDMRWSSTTVTAAWQTLFSSRNRLLTTNSTPTNEIQSAIPWMTTSAIKFIRLYCDDSASIHITTETLASYKPESIWTIAASRLECLIAINGVICNITWVECVIMFTVSSTLIWAVRTGQTDWVCHSGTLMLCVEAVV